VRIGIYSLDEGLALAEGLVRDEVHVGMKGDRKHAIVIWVVRASISRSSWERSEKPGRTCFA